MATPQPLRTLFDLGQSPDSDPQLQIEGLKWIQVLDVFIPGTPKGQPRPKSFAYKGHDGQFKARVYDPSTAEGWKSEISQALRDHIPAEPAEGAVIVNLTWYMPRPKYMMGKRWVDGPIPYLAKPDRDNLDKACLDCLKVLGFYRDDAQVFHGAITKFYAGKHGRSGMQISIWREAEA